MPDLLMGVDIGTASSKGVLVTSDGEIIATAVRAHATSFPRPGWAEHDANGIWWGDFVAIARELMGRTSASVAGVAVSGIGPCLLPVDAADRPLRPAILYGVDTRAVAEIQELTDHFGREAILRRGGSALSSQAVGPKLLWLRHHEPDVWAATRRFFMASSYVVHRLTGEYILDHGSASQCDPLYDLADQAWAPDWADEIAPGLTLPALVWPSDVVGTISAEAALITGLREGVPVVAGTIDAWAEAASTGAYRTRDLMLMYGSTMFFVETVERPVVDERLWSTVGIFAGTWSVAAGLATSGAITDWFKRLVGVSEFAELVGAAKSVVPGSDGLLVLPYFAGERTPIFDPSARGVIAGLTLGHGRGQLYRALLEGTAFAVRHNLEVFDEIGAEPARIIGVGGGTTDALWPQIVSDVTGRTQQIPSVTVGASYGDAFLAAIGLGFARRSDEWNPPASVVTPDPSARAVYDRLYDMYRSLYPSTLEILHGLARIQVGAA